MRLRARPLLPVASAAAALLLASLGWASGDAGGNAPAAPLAGRGESSAGAEATLVGFRKTGDDSALVYVQLTGMAEVKSEQHGLTLTFTLRGVSVPKKNNLNPLVATHFDTILESARLVQSGKNTELVVVLRRAGTASTQVVRAGDGAVVEVHLTAAPKSAAKP